MGRLGERFSILCLTSDKYPPARVDVAVLFGKELASRGHRIDWGMPAQEDTAQSYRVRWGSGWVRVARCDNGTSVLARLRKNLWDAGNDVRVLFERGERHDIIQVKDKFLAAVFAWIVARWRGARFVYWLSYPFPEADLHAWREGTARYPLLYRVRGAVRGMFLYRFILRVADHCFVQSEQMKRDIAARGIPVRKMTPVPMGIDGEEYDGEHDVAIRRREILYLGTLIKERRLDFLLRVLLGVLESNPDVRLVFVGDGEDPSDRAFLERTARELGVAAQVEFAGQLPRREALARARRAAVCLSPFYPTPILNSTSPTKLVEYLALGRPVVANEHPEQRDVIERSGGGLCVPYEERAFADAIAYLLAHPREADAMGERGRQYVRGARTYPHIADTVEAVYLGLLHGAGEGVRPEVRLRKQDR